MESRIDKNNLVVKSNKLVEGAYQLQTREQRLILTLCSMVQYNDIELTGYMIKISELSAILEVETGYTQIAEVAKGLLKKTLIIAEEDGPLMINWLSSVKHHQRKGVIEFSFDPKLKPYLLHLKSLFTKYQLSNILKLRSSYSIRIYELLKQYEKIGQRTFTIAELRQKLGVPESTYKAYGDFKRRILTFAQMELTECTDLTFDAFEIKEGRKVEKITFLIRANKPVEPEKKRKKKRKKEIPPEKLEALKAEYLESIKDNAFLMNRFRKGGFDNVTVRMNFEGYLNRV